MYRIVTTISDDHEAAIPALHNLTLEEAHERAKGLSQLSPSGVRAIILDYLDDPVAYYFQGLEQPGLFGE